MGSVIIDYKVSVIIPTYNSSDSLEKSVKSVINQSFGFENIELIIVDDASTDNTKNIIENLSIKYENIVPFYLKENNGSPSNARNVGIDNASSDYIMFLDDDDIYDEKMVETLYSEIISNNVPVVGCQFYIVQNGEKFSYNNGFSEKTFFNPQKDYNFYLRVMVWDKIYDKNFLNKYNIRFPVGCLFEDINFNVNVLINSYSVLFLGDYYGCYHIIRNEENNFSIGHICDFNSLQKSIDGFKKELHLFDNFNNKEVANKVLSSNFSNLLAIFVKLKIDSNFRIIFNQIRDLELQSDYIFNFNTIWFRLINNLIIKNRYKLTCLCCRLLQSILSSKRLYNFYVKKFYICHGKIN